MKKNKANYKKGKMRIDGVTGVFERTHKQDCGKCCFRDQCGRKTELYCLPSTSIDRIIGQITSTFGRGHFVREEKVIRKYKGEYYKRVKDDGRHCAACPLLEDGCRFGEAICYTLFSESEMEGMVLEKWIDLSRIDTEKEDPHVGRYMRCPTCGVLSSNKVLCMWCGRKMNERLHIKK